jgi:hypothetical protein
VWYEFVGKVLLRDFLEWRLELRAIEDLGAFRLNRRSENGNVNKVGRRNLIVGTGEPERIHLAELTAAAFRAARCERCRVGRFGADEPYKNTSPYLAVVCCPLV